MMDWQYTPFIWPLLIAAGILAALVIPAWKRRSAPGAIPFICFALALFEWSLVYAVQLGSTDLDTHILLSNLRFIGILLAPTTWLLFIIEYTGRSDWLTRRNLLLLTFMPLVTALVVWTNGAHHLFWAKVRLEDHSSLRLWDPQNGPLFWLHAAYSYFLLISGLLMLVQALARSPKIYRKQAGVLLAGMLLPVISNALTALLYSSFPLDLTPFAFVIASLVMAWSLTRYRLLDIVPIARSAIFDSMHDGVMVLDAQSRIIDLNPAAQRILGISAANSLGRLARDVLAAQTTLVERYRDVTEIRDEIVLGEQGAQRHYELNISPLHDRRGHLSGRLVILRNITDYKKTQAALQSQIQLFESLVAVARATSENLSLKATLQSSLDVATKLTKAEMGSLFLLDAAGQVTHSILAYSQIPATRRQELIRQVMERGLAGWVAQHRQSALIHNTHDDDRWLVLPETAAVFCSALCVPIMSDQNVLGVLTLTHSQTGHFDHKHATLLQAAADQMVLALRNAQMFEEQRRLAKRQTILYQTLHTVGGHLEPETVAQAAVEAVVQLGDWSAVAVLLPDESEQHLIVRAAAGLLSDAVNWRLSVKQGVSGRAFRSKQTLFVPDVTSDPDYVCGHDSICSELAVPLRRGGRTLGVLDIESDQVHAFDAEDVPLAETLADAIALALDNARLYAESRQHAADLSALYAVTRMISRSLTLQDVVSRALSAVLSSLSFDAGLVCLVDKDDGHLHLTIERGLPPAWAERLKHDGLKGTLCAYVHQKSQNLVIHDLQLGTSAVANHLTDELAAAGLRAYIGIPLLHQDKPLGTLGLFARQSRNFSTKEMALLNTIGQQVASAITNARLFQTITDERGRLQALIESNRDGIALIGINLHVLLVNAQALQLLNLPGEPDDWAGRLLQDAVLLIHRHTPRTARAVMAEIRRVVGGDESPKEDEYQISLKTIRWLNLPVSAGDTPLGRLLVLRDVTQERLVDQMRDDLTRTMVHDLRNPLTAISVSLQLLDLTAANDLPANQRRMLESARSGTQQMLKLVNNILDVSRLEEGHIRLQRTPLSLAELVAETLCMQTPLAADKELCLESDVPFNLPLAWADSNWIDRVLQNLVGNAIKFTPKGGQVRVKVRAQPDKDPPHLLISVADNGAGIAPELYGRLFQKFVAGDLPQSGSGLGLAFCKLVVETHGGRIWLQSKPEQGATFNFTLPIWTVDRERR